MSPLMMVCPIHTNSRRLTFDWSGKAGLGSAGQGWVPLPVSNSNLNLTIGRIGSPGQLYCELLHFDCDLMAFGEFFGLQEAEGSARGLDEPLTLEVAQTEVDRLPTESH